MDIFWILRKEKDASDLVAVIFVDYIKKSFTFECYFEMIFCRISYLCYSYASFKICKNMFLRFNWFFGMNRFVTYCCEKRELAKGSGSGKPKLRAKFSHQNDLGELDNA